MIVTLQLDTHSPSDRAALALLFGATDTPAEAPPETSAEPPKPRGRKPREAAPESPKAVAPAPEVAPESPKTAVAPESPKAAVDALPSPEDLKTATLKFADKNGGLPAVVKVLAEFGVRQTAQLNDEQKRVFYAKMLAGAGATQ
jgi:hypothetical protein